MQDNKTTAISLMRALRKRDIGRSKNPSLAHFTQEVLPVLSAVAGPVAGILAARRAPGLGAAALGGGIAAAGNLPRFMDDIRRSREVAPMLKGNRQQTKNLKTLGLASGAGLGSTVLGGLGAGMKPGRLANLTNAASWGLLVPALGTILYQSYKDKQPK